MRKQVQQSKTPKSEYNEIGNPDTRTEKMKSAKIDQVGARRGELEKVAIDAVA
jgi:hypothetical protein